MNPHVTPDIAGFPPRPATPRSWMVPCPWSIRCLEVAHTFWNVLAYEQDGMEAEAAKARAECAKAAALLRHRFDLHPALGPEAADVMIAYCASDARRWFALDLNYEQRECGNLANWRAKRGQRRRYM